LPSTAVFNVKTFVGLASSPPWLRIKLVSNENLLRLIFQDHRLLRSRMKATRMQI
jgi:hypothetical protein